MVTFERAVEVFEHATRSPLDSVISPRQVVNEVGNFLYGARPWKFLERGQGFLDLRARVEGSTATTTGTTLTLTNAFTSYPFLAGDVVEIASGSSATPGFYPVASMTDASNVVLASAPGNSAGNVAFTLHCDAAALPSDFGSMIAYQAKDSYLHSLTLTGFQHLLELRTSNVALSGFDFYAAITHARPNSGGRPVPRLELYPAPLVNEVGRLRIFYREAWRDVDDDTGLIDIPAWFEGLFFFALREWAQGYEGKADDQGGLFDRMDRLLASSVFMAAAQNDGRIQPDYGMQRGGNAASFMLPGLSPASAFMSTNLTGGPS